MGVSKFTMEELEELRKYDEMVEIEAEQEILASRRAGVVNEQISDPVDDILFPGMAEKKKIQLIVTTHESRLMDFDLLRRDEIWFINKKKNGESDIYSLEEYNARFDQKIDKAYMEGRYGGVPIFSTIFPVGEE